MSDDGDDKIHPATPARAQAARREGQFAHSHELASAIQMLGGLAIAALCFGSIGLWLKEVFQTLWSSPLMVTGNNSVPQLQELAFASLKIFAPIGILAVVLAIFSNWCQTGPVMVTGRVLPDAGRVTPGRWFERIFRGSTFVFPLIGFPKLILGLLVLAACCWLQRDSFLALGAMPLDQMVDSMFWLTIKTCAIVGGALFVASLVDFGLKYREYQNLLRMTDQELREEVKSQGRKATRRRNTN